jgi:hypothetical protein
MRLLPLVLLRHDERVKQAYEAWRARAVRYEEAGEFTEAGAMRFLFESSVQLNQLVRELKLERYQSWLPSMLSFEFHRYLESAPRVEVTIPKDAWGKGWPCAEKRTQPPRGSRAVRDVVLSAQGQTAAGLEGFASTGVHRARRREGV